MLDQPLLRTKISPPQIPNKFVHRPRLTERVKLGVQGPLTLLAAPAGFGKTNLLLEWAKEADLPVAWLALDSDDNDLSRFFRYFIGALQTLVPRLGEEALEFIQFTGGSNLEVGLTLLINELSTLLEEIALVLDDFQVLENPAALQGVGFLLKYLPPNLHLVIASRSEPEINLAYLRAKGRVVELGAEELRFTGAEIEQYFQQVIGLQLPPETVQALEERTAGWIAALQMAAISLKNQADPETLLAHMQGKVHYLAEFLAEEILDRQPEEVRQFLLRSSILETLSGPLCEAVVNPDAQPGYGAMMLKRLEQANAFITAIDEKHEWFRYHPLFADFLCQVQAESNPGELSELHKRAALWLAENGDLNEAFRQAHASRDMEWAADMIERNSHMLLKTGELSTLNHWVGKLPVEATHRRPYLILTYAWALIATNQLDLAQDWLDDVLRTVNWLEQQMGAAPNLDERETMDGFGRADLQYFHGSSAVCQSILAMLRGDMEQAAEFFQQATHNLSEENIYLRSLLALDDSLSSISSGDTHKAIESLRATMRIARQANNSLVLIIAACALADLQALQGQLSKAWETLQRAHYFALGPEGKPLPLIGLVDIGLGEILLTHDLLDEAREYLERGCRVTQSMWYLGSLEGMVSLARLYHALGDIPDTLEVIEEATRMTLSSDASQWDEAFVAALAVRLALQRDDLASAEQWWHKSGFSDLNTPIALESYPYHVFEYLLLTQARFLLVRGQETGSQGDLNQAAARLEPFLPKAKRLGRAASQIEILVLQALAYSSLGDEGAEETLLQALALGEPEGYRRIFIDEGWRLADLLRSCRSIQEESGSYFPSLAFIDGILRAIQPDTTAKPADEQPIKQLTGKTVAYLEDGLPIALSAREMEVLGLIADGKSNQEISAELYLALNTVKRHAYNINAKLETNKRTQAVAKARHLGLIE